MSVGVGVGVGVGSSSVTLAVAVKELPAYFRTAVIRSVLAELDDGDV